MSPPLVVAFALAGRVDIDFVNEPIGYGKNQKPVFLKDIWPSSKEIQEAISKGLTPEMFKQRYAHVRKENPIWNQIKTVSGTEYAWDETSTYIQCPPFFDNFSLRITPKKSAQRNATSGPVRRFNYHRPHLSCGSI